MGNMNSTQILVIVGVIVAIILFIRAAIRQRVKFSKMTPEQKKAEAEANSLRYTALQFGEINPALFCPHCQTKGAVRAKAVSRKKGVSGGKAVGALLTGGVSMLATGLSRKEGETQAHCMNCGSTWHF